MENNWPKVKLSEITKNLDSKRRPISKENRIKGPIPYYGATGIVDHVNDYIFDEPLLLIGEDGADWSRFATTAYEIYGKSWVNNHAHVLSCSGINKTYLKEYLNFQDLNSLVTGGTRGKLTKAALNNVSIPLPPKKVQEKISNILKSIDQSIEKTEQVIQKTEDLKQGLMNELLIKGVGHSKFKRTKFGDIPEDWDVQSFTNITEESNTRNNKLQLTSEQIFGVSKIYGLIPMKERIKGKNSERYKIVQDKAFAYNPMRLNIGSISQNRFKRNVLVSPDYVVFHSKENIVLSEYLDYLIQSSFWSNFTKKAGDGGVRVRIYYSHLSNLYFPIPSLEEQRKLIEILKAIDSKIKCEKKNLLKHNNFKKGLLNDIFNQKIYIN
jgi:type I restriction enzyme S subunit